MTAIQTPTKYTDEDAVSAVLTDDQYVRNDQSDSIAGEFTALRSLIVRPDSDVNTEFAFLKFLDNVGALKFQMASRMGSTAANRYFYYYDYYLSKIIWWWKDNRINLNDNIVKDPKNHVDATLSGTPKIVEIDIGGTPYYIKAYPTKT